MLNKYPSRADIVAAMRNPSVSYKAKELQGGRLQFSGSRVVQYAGGYTTVFPFQVGNAEKVAVRCWIADIGEAKRRSIEISNFLVKLNSDYFCNFKYVESALLINGKLYPVVIMDWVEGLTLKEFIQNNRTSVSLVRDNFKRMTKYFHSEGIAHGDLQHGNLLVKPDGNVTCIDYDSMYIPALNGMADVIKGLPGYQHPARSENAYVNEKIDYFSELIIYLSLLYFEHHPNEWQHYYNTEDLLFSKNDFLDYKNSSLIWKMLNDNNSEIVNLTKVLIESLHEKNILSLNPLETHLIDKLAIMKSSIEEKFDRSSKQRTPTKKINVDINNISNKF